MLTAGLKLSSIGTLPIMDTGEGALTVEQTGLSHKIIKDFICPYHTKDNSWLTVVIFTCDIQV